MKANLNWHKMKADSIKNTLNAKCDRILVYSGTMPTTPDTYTKAAYSANLLNTYTVAASSFVITSDDYLRVYMGTIPVAVNASGTGTCTWFAATAAANDTYVLIGEASSVSGSGILTFWDAAFTTGAAKEIYSFAFALKQL